MNCITHNPYRILGVFANDPLKARIANVSRIRAFNKVGKVCEFESDIKAIFGNIDRSEQAVEQAISLLSSESEADFYSCLWIHRTQQLNKTSKAPIDIIQSGIGSKDKSDIVNVLVGAILADNIHLSAEYLVKLFECDNTIRNSVKERLIVTLGGNFIDDSSSLFPTVWWAQLRDYCNSGDEHDDSLSFIAKVFNKESMNYLRRVTEVIEKEKDTKASTLSVFLNGNRPIIEIVKETCNLHSKEPNAEAQIVLSEYAAASLSASKKYYENTRFWDAGPIEGLLEKLREIYKISYSSKTKEECTEFYNKVKNELPYLAPSEVKSSSATIRKEVEAFCTKPNETRWALHLLQNCVAPLVEIKKILGGDNLYYRRISTQIADNAIFASSWEIDSAIRKYNNPVNEKNIAKDNLSRVLVRAKQLYTNIAILDLENRFIDNNLNKFNDKIKNCSQKYGILIENMSPTISIVTEDESYKQCEDYNSLIDYLQSHPDSPHTKDVIQRIWKIEDTDFPQLATSMQAYRKALFAYKEKYPNSHNEQKLLKEIEEMLLGRVSIGTPQEYRTLLKLWPNHPKKSIILGRLDLASFKMCQTPADWKQYLKDFPAGQYREEALRLIRKAAEKVEEDAFNKCVSIADLNRFIFKYPQSPLSNKAADKIEDMVYAQVVKSGDYDSYFKQYPNGKYIVNLNRLMDDKCFNQCKKKSDYKQYLEKYPQGGHTKQAKAYIEKVNRRYLLLVSFVVALTTVVLIVFFSNGKSSNSNGKTQSTTGINVPDKMRDLYVFLQNEGYTFMGTESMFLEKLKNHNNIDDLYVFLQDKGYDFMGTMEEFEDTINIAMAHIGSNNNTSYSGNYTSASFDFDSEFKYNSLATGAKPYKGFFGRERTGKNYFKFKTSGSSDFVVIVKRHYDDAYINHIYIQGGDNAYLYVPDGTFDVYFYSGEGWNPYKEVGQFTGGFVNGNMQKDDPVELESAYMEYTLYPVKYGNLRLQSANMNDVFN